MTKQKRVAYPAERAELLIVATFDCVYLMLCQGTIDAGQSDEQRVRRWYTPLAANVKPRTVEVG